jgi:hypothetical protein
MMPAEVGEVLLRSRLSLGKKKLGGFFTKNDNEEGVASRFIYKKGIYHQIVDEGLGL